jgi:hypothetical protein
VRTLDAFRCALLKYALAIWPLASTQIGKGEHFIVASDDGEP